LCLNFLIHYIFLGKLAQFKGKSIDDVLKSSIIEYYENSTFNSVSDIVELFANLGIEIKNLKPYFPDLENLMKRRHQIVHRIDRSGKIDAEIKAVSIIDPTELGKWIQAVYNFFTDTLIQAAQQGLFIFPNQ
jgi:RiboL-PSP-HEPN